MGLLQNKYLNVHFDKKHCYHCGCRNHCKAHKYQTEFEQSNHVEHWWEFALWGLSAVNWVVSSSKRAIGCQYPTQNCLIPPPPQRWFIDSMLDLFTSATEISAFTPSSNISLQIVSQMTMMVMRISYCTNTRTLPSRHLHGLINSAGFDCRCCLIVESAICSIYSLLTGGYFLLLLLPACLVE